MSHAIHTSEFHRWRFSDAVGIIIRVRDAEGNHLPDELVKTTQVSKLTVELDLEGRTRMREQVSPKRPEGSHTWAPGGTEDGGGRLPAGETSEQTQMMVRVLQRNFPTMIHAFALFDADDGNEVGLIEVRNAVHWLHKREKAKGLGDDRALADFDSKAFIRELSSSNLAGRGATLNLNDFVRKIRFGDNVENWKEKLEVAREWRNALLQDEHFKETQYVSTMGTGFLDELKSTLKAKFGNAAEAFVFFDRTCCGVLTEAAWRVGLKRLGVDINVKHLMMVLDGNCADGKVDEVEFREMFAWHTLENWDAMMLDAKVRRKAIANDITMRKFKETAKKLPPLNSSLSSASFIKSSRSKTPELSMSNASLTVGNTTYNGTGKRGAAQWQLHFISRVAASLNPPANPNRFTFIGFQEVRTPSIDTSNNSCAVLTLSSVIVMRIHDYGYTFSLRLTLNTTRAGRCCARYHA